MTAIIWVVIITHEVLNLEETVGMNFIIKLMAVMIIALSINIFLGRWRVKTRKFSLHWFLAIHIAVPLIYLLRVYEGLAYWTIPFLVVFSVLGQIVGGRL
ncbi:hypothetical protein [Desulfosporosinus orientis]|nr:hypothetical protein [Desulfosporosinus orientis]